VGKERGQGQPSPDEHEGQQQGSDQPEAEPGPRALDSGESGVSELGEVLHQQRPIVLQGQARSVPASRPRTCAGIIRAHLADVVGTPGEIDILVEADSGQLPAPFLAKGLVRRC
jgi:hypothetical protein